MKPNTKKPGFLVLGWLEISPDHVGPNVSTLLAGAQGGVFH
jgi:hypothetical protein